MSPEKFAFLIAICLSISILGYVEADEVPGACLDCQTCPNPCHPLSPPSAPPPLSGYPSYGSPPPPALSGYPIYGAPPPPPTPISGPGAPSPPEGAQGNEPPTPVQCCVNSPPQPYGNMPYTPPQPYEYVPNVNQSASFSWSLSFFSVVMVLLVSLSVLF